MVARQEWLDEGLAVLAANGLPGLRIEALTTRLKVAKGSFYHHFVDLADYRRALLGHFEETSTRQQVLANAALDDLPVTVRLGRARRQRARAGDGAQRSRALDPGPGGS